MRERDRETLKIMIYAYMRVSDDPKLPTFEIAYIPNRGKYNFAYNPKSQ